MDTSPFPEAESPDLERYTLYSRAEIVALLKQLRDEGTLVTAYFGLASDFAVTLLLQVKTDFEEVILDCVSDKLAQRRLLAAEHLTLVAFLASIKVQFTARHAEAVSYEGKPAFRIRLPDQVLRLQRRDYFRVQTPVTRPPTVLVPHTPGSLQYESLRVLDLSVGGLAILSYPEKFEMTGGTTIDACFLDLPGVGSMSVGLQVRHVEPLAREAGARRCGCEFVDLSPQSRLMLQRYVNRIEADQRRAGGPARQVA